ncbi:SusC/RagA family TonB-linked outer membrane protein [Segetibacter aerophilus]|uniref:SusC/RagA family TonB-linked outer membrane protein n=1 Tax=Segetibacter aerophilus TaxID=670293 RepID=A0A512BD32_9BACT|nr:TonB-dependent receptor [Segetibacter aerophilus]GEO09873.1 SusC/RagA family TonB-linked outer membrane protein [Segetibacter aerophilus]
MKKSYSYSIKVSFLSLIMVLATFYGFSQGRTVNGTIIGSQDNAPLSGVSVLVKGSNQGTATDAAGKFSIAVPSNSAVLVFSSTGFEAKEVRVGNQAEVNVTLQAAASNIGEVVVIGYGTQRKSDLTGSVGSVKASQLQERPAASLNQALAGRIAGVQVNTNSGRPGGQTNIRIRGFSSISSSNNPLYVIDGVFLPTGTQTQNSNVIDYINPNDIASIEVLKDASATAIYGARGANGVILITTKRGTSGVPRVTYDADFSVPTIGPHRVKMLNAQQFLQVENLAYDNIKVYDPAGWAAGNYSNVVDPRVKRKSLPLLFDANGNPLYDTDWLKESTQNKLSQNHQLGITGGNENTTYGAFVGWRNDNGLLINSYLKRYSGRFTVDSKVKDWLRIGGSLSYNNQQENLVDIGTGGLNSVRMITEGLPILPVKYPDGSWGENWQYPGMEGGSNPVHIMTERKYIVNTQTTLGNLYTSINLAKGLEFRSQFGASIINRGTNQYSGRTLDQLSRDQSGIANVANSNETYWSSENYFTYNTSFSDKHKLTALLGLSWQATNFFSLGAESRNFSTDYLEFNNLGAGSLLQSLSSNKSGFAFNSYFGRLNYSLNEKYLFTVTARADGSSKFGANNLYSLFPSAAFAWRASDENFFKNNNTISNLKFRTSYGLTGNSEIAAYSSDALLGSYTAVINNLRVTGVGTNRLANPDLRWEKTAQYDAGFELGLFKNRVSLEADYYYRKTTDMLLAAPVPRTSGFSSIQKNIGSMENKGIELTLNTVNISNRDFSWNSTFNISMNRNKVLSLATPAPIFSGNPNFLSNTGIIQVGQPVGSFWGLVRLGVWTEAERAEAAKFASYRGGKPILPGDLKYLDVDGNYAINDADRVILGNGNPKGWGTFANSFKYKQFNLLVELQFVYGNSVLNQTKHSAEDRVAIANSYTTVLDAYDPSKSNNTNTMIAAIRDTRAGYVTNVDSHWIEDGGFLRGRNALLSYTFPASTAQSMHLSRLRAYVSVQNFFLKTKFSGNDPEVTTYGNAFAQGQTFFDYPKPTIYMLGINVGL